jgi:Protein of unknown function (DUF3987)
LAQTNGAWTDLIDEFMQYTEKRISPDIHRLWAAISMVGGACERRVWVRAGDYISYPSFYILLVAPPGVGKSIINDVKELWTEAEEPSGGPAFHIASDNVTRASLVDELNEATSTRLVNGSSYTYHNLLLPAEEFEEFLPFYDSTVISLLNSVWNNKPSHSESRRHGPARRIDIRNPCLNILGGVQPAYFVAHFSEEAWTTGLIRRFLMIYADTPPLKNPFDRTPNRDAIKSHILGRLAHISTLYGEAKWAENSANEVANWHMAGGPPTPTHSRLKYYLPSRTIFITKLALISAVSRTGALIIEEPDVKRAMVWLFEAEKRMPDIFRAMLGKSDTQVMEELHYFISTEWMKEKKGVRTTLIHHFLSQRVPSEKITNIMQTAEKSGMMMKSTDNVNLWLPKPKHLHGVE